MNPKPPPDLPSRLDHRWTRVAQRLRALPPDTFAPFPAALETVSRVVLCSDFVLSTLLAQPQALLARLMEESSRALDSRFGLSEETEAGAVRTLRRVRNVEMARIAWRDLAGWADLQTSLKDLSQLADGAIRAALEFAQARLSPRFGRPLGPQGAPESLVVLAMGKLGGRELNYSSDVDLVFLFPDAVTFQGGGGAVAEDYFRRLAQLLLKLLDQITEDGFVFRVDTRLRPFGSSGPLVVSIPALENYLIQNGRDWERYAYLKARLVTGDGHRDELFDEILNPFVYRRYLDYGVFNSLRQMKALIAAEVARRDMEHNVKLGPGGIREIEFIVQSLQLVRAGRAPALRERSLLAGLRQLERAGLMGSAAAEGLGGAYRFLRTVENRLQAMNDRQTHDLPSDPEARAILAYGMGARDWDDLAASLARHRALVETEFARVVFHERGAGGEGDRWGQAWEAGRLGEEMKDTNLAQADTVRKELEALRDSGLYHRMDETSRQRLASVVAQIVPRLQSYAEPGRILERIIPLLRAVGRRSAYLALLRENPSALERLLKLADRSEFLIRQVADHPLLLDELLDARVFDRPPTREELERTLEEALTRQPSADVEGRLEAIRLFKRAAVFRIAVADRLGSLALMKVSDRLTDTAELILRLALETARSELAARFGEPVCGKGAHAREAGFAIVGYGKLGGLELGYGSDLDLVFLHDSSGPHQETTGPRSVENGRFFARLSQRLIHFLSIQTGSGRLYEVDTRLRPNGQSGLPVPSLDSFAAYQREKAWVWEHQALLRSRAVAGSPKVRDAFEQIRKDVLIQHVNRDGLRQEISSMRRRMRRELSASTAEEFDLKQDPGGLSDIEFLIDYWVLSNSGRFPALVAFPDKVRQLEALERTGIVSAERCLQLKDAYIGLRGSAHELALNEGGRVVHGGAFAAEREWISALWAEVLG